MKYIILSTDGPISVYEVPDKVAKDLTRYCVEFCKWVECGPKAKQFRKGYLPEREFIEYLNTVVNPNYIYKSRLIKTFEDDNIPEQYRNLPYFNF